MSKYCDTKMDVILFKWSLYRGGAEKQLLLLYRYLKQNGIHVKIYTAKYSKAMVSEFSAYTDLVCCRSEYDAIGKLVKYSRNDRAVILHAWDSKASILGFIVKLLKGHILLDGSVRSAPNRSMSRFRLFKAKYIVFNLFGIPIISNSVAGLTAYGIYEKKNTYVIYNAIQARGKANKRGKLKYGFNVVMTANMRWKKDYRTFIKSAIVILNSISDIGFYLIGDGPDADKYKRIVSDSLYKDHFFILGKLASPLDVVVSNDVGVLCNEYSGEGISNSIMEYMICKLPTIATDMGGNPEIVKHEETGYLIKEHDYRDLANKIMLLYQDRDLARQLGGKAYQVVINEFGEEKMGASYMALYRSILNERKPYQN